MHAEILNRLNSSSRERTLKTLVHLQFGCKTHAKRNFSSFRFFFLFGGGIRGNILSPKFTLAEFLAKFIGSTAFSRDVVAKEEIRRYSRDRKRPTCRAQARASAAKETAQDSTCLPSISLRGIGKPSVCFWNSRTIPPATRPSFLLSVAERSPRQSKQASDGMSAVSALHSPRCIPRCIQTRVKRITRLPLALATGKLV